MVTRLLVSTLHFGDDSGPEIKAFTRSSPACLFLFMRRQSARFRKTMTLAKQIDFTLYAHAARLDCPQSLCSPVQLRSAKSSA